MIVNHNAFPAFHRACSRISQGMRHQATQIERLHERHDENTKEIATKVMEVKKSADDAELFKNLLSGKLYNSSRIENPQHNQTIVTDADVVSCKSLKKI